MLLFVIFYNSVYCQRYVLLEVYFCNRLTVSVEYSLSQ